MAKNPQEHTLFKQIEIYGQRFDLYSSDKGRTWSSSLRSIVAYEQRKKRVKVELQKEFELIEEPQDPAPNKSAIPARLIGPTPRPPVMLGGTRRLYKASSRFRKGTALSVVRQRRREITRDHRQPQPRREARSSGSGQEEKGERGGGYMELK